MLEGYARILSNFKLDTIEKDTLAPMPELPDITVYVEALERRIIGERLDGVRIQSPLLLRTFDPPLESVNGKTVREVRRLGKRIVLGLDDELWLVLHLMIAGRLHWKEPGVKLATKAALAILTFSNGTLLLTEAGTKRRASLPLIRGLSMVCASTIRAASSLRSRRRSTSFKASCDSGTTRSSGPSPIRIYSAASATPTPTRFSIAAPRLSPLALSQKLTADEVERLYTATRSVLLEWVERLRGETRDGWPRKVTAFRPGMAVHGRFGEPCPVCGAPIQRIRYADNETNYCPRCQTNGRILADRSLSRLLKDDWPRHLDEL